MEGTATGSETGTAERAVEGLRWFVAVPARKRTYANLAYLLLAFPLGLAYFVALTVGVAVGIGLLILLVGVFVLATVIAGSLAVAQGERWLTNRLLGTEVTARTDLEGESVRDRATSLLLDRRTWLAPVYLGSKFVLGLASFVGVSVGLSTAVAMLLVPLYYDRPGLYVGFLTDRPPEFHQTIYLAWNQLLVGFEAVLTVGYWEVTTLPQALTVAIAGCVLGLLTLHAVNGLARLWGWWTRLCLDGGYDPIGALRGRES